MKWHNFSILVCAWAVSASASAAQFVFVSPTQGTPAPTQIGSFDRVSPSGYGNLAPALYLSATELSLGSVHIGESATKAFTVINNSPKSISGITASVTTLMGDADAHVDVKCSPPLTLYSAAANEACDVLVTFNTSSAGTQTFSINMQGTASSYESVKGEFTFTAEVTDIEQPVDNGAKISFVTTAEDPNPSMYFYDQSYPEDRVDPAPVPKTINVQNIGDSAITEVFDVAVQDLGLNNFSILYSECGEPAGFYVNTDPDTGEDIVVTYPASPVTLNPGETCAIHTEFNANTSVLGYTAQGTLTVNSPSTGVITAGLSGKNTDLIASGLDIKFASSLSDSEILGWYSDLIRRYEPGGDGYLTNVGMFNIPITGTESVTIDSISFTPITGWSSRGLSMLSYIDGGPGYPCNLGTEIKFENQSCNFYVDFQADIADNSYAFRLDLTGTTASGQPISISRTISGQVPYSKGISVFSGGYSLNDSAFNNPLAPIELGCGMMSGWCGVYQVSVGNSSPLPVEINSVTLTPTAEFSDYNISRIDRGCNSTAVHYAWQLVNPDEFPGLYGVINDWSQSVTCQDTFVATRGTNFAGNPGEAYIEADLTVNYLVPSNGQVGSITQRQYVPLIFIELN